MVKRISYPLEVKEAAIRMKLAGKTTREIMTELNIRNKTQVETWGNGTEKENLIDSHKE